MTPTEAAAPVTERREQTIQLLNPVAEHYETWIVGNSMTWQVRALIEIQETMTPEAYTKLVDEFQKHRPSAAFAESQSFHDAILPFASKHYIVQEDSAKGQHLVLCGAGPTLTEHAREWCAKGDQVWGCNSALMWLHDRGIKVTHGFAVDQTPHMVVEWQRAPDVEYLLASTVHPHLSDHLMAKNRRWRWFHNYVGVKKPPVSWPDSNGVNLMMPYEEWLYALLYPPTIQAGSGLNAVTRALDVAQFMGFEKITVLGADCCLKLRGKPRHDLPFGSEQHKRWLKKHTVMHADGGHALSSEATAVTMGGYIDGRYWLTKPDMALSAQWLMRMARASNGRINLVGDTLPNALMDKDEAFLERMPNFITPDGKVANIPVFAGDGSRPLSKVGEIETIPATEAA